MATKSDLGQKLLHDLRLRKERMAATENSSQLSADFHGNAAQTYRGARQINAPESRRRPTEGSPHPIVPYERGRCSMQIKDLSMAIAVAFENSGKFSEVGAPSGDPLVNFFNRIGQGSLNYMKMDTASAHPAAPSVSHSHITEISKGVEKLNQILRACSNGLNFDRNSIQVGQELLKGAIDLEESLKTLANLQKASDYMNVAQPKSRIRLLEGYEDDGHNTDKLADQRQVDCPRFSFDKPSRNAQVAARNSTEQPVSNSKMIPHKRSDSCVPDFDSLTLKNQSSSSQEKGRISNVIAKLMGLEEVPQMIEKDLSSKGDDKKVSSKTSKFPEPFISESSSSSALSADRKSIKTNNSTLVRDLKSDMITEKRAEVPDGSPKMANSERNLARKDLKILAVAVDAVSGPKIATVTMSKQLKHGVAQSEFDEPQIFCDSERKQTLTGDREKKITETWEGKVLVKNNELQHKAQKNNKTHIAEETSHEKIEPKASTNLLEKRNANKDLKEKPEDKCAPQMQVIKKPECSEDTQRGGQKRQQLQKQSSTAKKHKERQVESLILSKTKPSVADEQKTQIHDKITPENVKLMKTTEEAVVSDVPNIRHQGDAPMIKTPPIAAANQEKFKKEHKSENSSPREPQNDIAKASDSTSLLNGEHPIDVSATKKKVISKKIQKSENSRKMDVLMTRRSGTVNHLTRSSKQSASMLQDLKQQMHKKNGSISKKMKQQSDRPDNGRGIGVITSDALAERIDPTKQKDKLQNEAKQSTLPITSDAPTEITEPTKEKDKLQNEAERSTMSNNSVRDECQTENILNMLTPNDNCDTASNSEKVPIDLQKVEQPQASIDEQELKQYDQSSGGNKSSTVLHSLSQLGWPMQFPASGRQEQLAEAEKELKEIVIKSQLFLNTAEALFKLNIPLSFLHAGDHNDDVENKKLILDCGYEVMKRKAKRIEITLHPYKITTISCSKLRSLDDLIKQLWKDLEILKLYGGCETAESDVASHLYEMMNKDIHNKDPDVNSMWDFEWNNMMQMLSKKEDIVRDVEKRILNKLLDEITNDLFCV